MPLLNRMTGYDTWPEMERAAEARFWDGFALATQNRRHHGIGAVYMLGYVAETLLKTAYYRVRKIARHADLGPELHRVRQRAKSLGFEWLGNYHNLDSWTRLLVEERRGSSSPMDPVVAGQLRRRVLSLMANWSEELRYKDATASESELADVFESIEWVRGQYPALWS